LLLKIVNTAATAVGLNHLSASLGGLMKRAACFVLGSCLTLHVPANYAAASKRASASEAPLHAPLHRFEHTGGVASAEDVSAEKYANFIFESARTFLPERYKSAARSVASAIIDEANRQHFDPLLLVAVIRQESRFNPDARGTHGEIGLMQIKPSTARWLGERAKIFSKAKPPSDETLRRLLHDPAFNIRMGASYLAQLKKTFRGGEHNFLSAYNMGPGLLRQHLRSQTRPRVYSSQVFDKYMQLTELFFSDAHPEFEHRVASISSFN
jgi:soluble lytic murein transglycosylase